MNENILENKAKTITAAVYALCGIAAIGTVVIWAHPCTGALELANGNAVPMRCFYTGKIAVLLGMVLVSIGAASFATKRDFSIPALLVSVCLIAITFDFFAGIGVCKAEMACWTTAFWLRTLGGVSSAAIIAGMVFSNTRKRVR